MPTLLEIQRAFRDAVLGPGPIEDEAGVLADAIIEDGLAAHERLQIYRNNTIVLLVEALAETFSVTHKLVGDDFFRHMTRDFVRQHPPETPSLIGYGRTFPGFIDGFKAAGELPYLGDVAGLEWAWAEAYHAPDTGPLDPQVLQAAGPERMGEVAFHLHPSARLVSSPYPIVAIWEANQPNADADATISLDVGGALALVIRTGRDVDIRTLAPGAFAFLSALMAGDNAADAFADASRVDPAFDLEFILGMAIADGTLTGASLDGIPLHATLDEERTHD